MRVRWSLRAEAELDNQVRHIAREGVRTALRIQDRVLEAVDRLAHMPRMGRVGRMAGTRELVITRTPFVAVYEINETEVLVLALLHGAQQWPPID